MVAISGQEGTPLTFDGSDSVPGEGETIVQLDWDFGDMSTVTGEVVSHTYADDGTYVVTLTVTDSQGGSGDTTRTLVVVNLDPELVVSASPSTVPEGQSSTISVTATDVPADLADLLYSFDCEGNGSIDVGPQTGSSAVCTYPDGDSFFDVFTEVTDGDGGRATSTVRVTVDNVAPALTVTANPDALPDEGGDSVITANAVDVPADQPTLMYRFDCDGDGTFEVDPQGPNTTTCSFGPEDTGSNTVIVEVIDKDGGTNSATTRVSVGARVLSPAPAHLRVGPPDIDPNETTIGAGVGFSLEI